MKFNEKLVLNSYVLSLFGVSDFKDLVSKYHLTESELEGINEEGNSLFYLQIINNITIKSNRKITGDKLREYDENITRHTKTMGRDIKWKYFQYLSLLFVEIYLDKYFTDKEQLLTDLNICLGDLNSTINTFNFDKKTKDKTHNLSEYSKDDLNKLALYNATGSGKTLLLHINLLQFNHYAKNKIIINKTVLITPNEGLSNQHLVEFGQSNIKAKIFTKESSGIFDNNKVEIIEITKIGDESGDKTVAVDSFEDNNLVFIDEGHRGSKGDIWKTNRDKLSKNGFAFEYSATFAQAISGDKKLEDEYSKAIIFDYSYKYFYNDGYGKEYSILNIGENDDNTQHIYLTASLLSFYQQMKIYHSNEIALEYLIEKPLMVFVGASVNAVRTENKKLVSDVIQVLLFIKKFIENKNQSIVDIKKIMSGDSGLKNSNGADIFDSKFSFINSSKPTAIFNDILRIIFNASGGVLHIENIKGVDGEVALRIGENEPFGVINVGDSDKLTKLCETKNMSIKSRDFSSSLFRTINDKTSHTNILIGSKKFSEGWNSWRVSTMGLMNIGKSEGSQIIQLFGRGIRLKGYDFCLKRSNSIEDKLLERKYQAIETLNIFGLQANYMKTFRNYLESEEVPINGKIEFVFPVNYNENYKGKKLQVIDLQKGKDFKREIIDLAFNNNKQVELNLYKQVDEFGSQDIKGNSLELNELNIKKYLSFINIDNIFFTLQEFKNEKGWNNLNIPKSVIKKLLDNEDWYVVYKEQMDISSFDNIAYIEWVIITLLKKYITAFYNYKQNKWESRFLEYRELDEVKDKGNLINNYTVWVEDKNSNQILIQELKDIEKELNNNTFSDYGKHNIELFNFNKHLYRPLIYKSKQQNSLKIQPVELNKGEKDFVKHLKEYLNENLKEEEIYVLRNQSKTGLGFFVEGNFYPDFIMWIKQGDKQYINFIDPKGIRNLDPLNDPKINLSQEIKTIQTKLKNNKIILNSFIVSNTSFMDLEKQHKDIDKNTLQDRNVFFQDDKNHIEEMFEVILQKP